MWVVNKLVSLDMKPYYFSGYPFFDSFTAFPLDAKFSGTTADGRKVQAYVVRRTGSADEKLAKKDSEVTAVMEVLVDTKKVLNMCDEDLGIHFVHF